MKKIILIILAVLFAGLFYYSYSLQKRIEKTESFEAGVINVVNQNAQIQQAMANFLNTATQGQFQNYLNSPKK